jgi:K+-transporting ATPase ATPase A chain
MEIIFIAIILGAAILLSWPLGKAITWAINPGNETGRFRQDIESIFLKIAGQSVTVEQDWKNYAFSMLLFNGCMFTVAFLILSFQHILPLNPDGKGVLEPTLVFHTVASFTSNTNLQHYSGEVSLSYFSQIFGLMWLQFVCHRHSCSCCPCERLVRESKDRKFLLRSYESRISCAAST